MKDVSEDRMRAKTKQEHKGRRWELGKKRQKTARELEREQKKAVCRMKASAAERM